MRWSVPILLVLSLLIAFAGAGGEALAAARPYEILLLNFGSNRESQVLERELGASPRFRITDPLEPDSDAEPTKAKIARLCESGYRPDVLLISAHFAASWAGKNGELSLQDLEELKCDPQYKGFFSQVQILFLFSCNNLLSAPKENEAPDQYIERLRREHRDEFSIEEIAQAGLDMYSDLLGTTYGSRIQRLFGNAQAILGTDGNAPHGPAAAEAFSRTLQRFRQTLGSDTVTAAVLELFDPGTRVAAVAALKGAWRKEMQFAAGPRKPVALSGEFVESRLNRLEAAAHTDLHAPLRKADELYCGSLSAWPEQVRTLSALTESDELVPVLLPQIVGLNDRYCEQEIEEQRCQTLTEYIRRVPTLRSLLEHRVRKAYLLAQRLESFGLLARLQWLEPSEQERLQEELVAQARGLLRGYSQATGDVVQLAVSKMPALIGRRLIPELERLRDRLVNDGEEAWTKVTIRRALNRFHEGHEKLTLAAGGKVAFSPDSRTVAAVDGSGSLKIIDTGNFDKRDALPVDDERLCASELLFTDAQSLIAGLCDGTIVRIEIPSRQEQVLLRHAKGPLAGLDYDSASGSFVVRWNPVASEGAATVEVYDRNWEKRSAWMVADRYVGVPVFCPGVPLVALMRSDGGLDIVDFSTGARLPGLDALHEVRSVQFRHDGSAAMIVSGLKPIYLYDLRARALQQLAVSEDAVVDMIELPQDRYAIVESSRIRVLDVRKREVVGTIPLEPYTQAAYYSATETSITTASTTGEAVIWNLATGGQRGVIRHPQSVVDVEGSRDGRYLITASRDGYARVYDTVKERVVGELPDQDNIQSAMLSPDARFAITKSGGNRVELWDVRAMLQREAAD